MVILPWQVEYCTYLGENQRISPTSTSLKCHFGPPERTADIVGSPKNIKCMYPHSCIYIYIYTFTIYKHSLSLSRVYWGSYLIDNLGQAHYYTIIYIKQINTDQRQIPSKGLLSLRPMWRDFVLDPGWNGGSNL